MTILMLAMSVKAITPLMDAELSNVNNPVSLSVNPDKIMKINNESNSMNDLEVRNIFLPTSSGSMIHFNINLFEDPDKTIERYSSNYLFSFFAWVRVNNTPKNNQIFLIDPVTGKSYTTLSIEDSNSYGIQTRWPNLITWKDYATIIDAEEANGYYIDTKTTITPSMAYPVDYNNTSDDPYRYNIKSGNTDMRDTYINDRNTNIKSGSWINIKTH
jgi:hypothetical protein